MEVTELIGRHTKEHQIVKRTVAVPMLTASPLLYKTEFAVKREAGIVERKHTRLGLAEAEFKEVVAQHQQNRLGCVSFAAKLLADAEAIFECSLSWIAMVGIYRSDMFACCNHFNLKSELLVLPKALQRGFLHPLFNARPTRWRIHHVEAAIDIALEIDLIKVLSVTGLGGPKPHEIPLPVFSQPTLLNSGDAMYLFIALAQHDITSNHLCHHQIGCQYSIASLIIALD